MKKIIYRTFAAAMLLVGVVACDTTPEALDLQPPYKYSEQYYANLRAYKESDHSICYCWFADYSGAASASGAFRFSALPDSIDIVSLWGGIPDKEKTPLNYKEMWEMRNKKGTKIVSVTIIRIMNFLDELGLTSDDVYNDTKTIDPDGEFPDWCIKFGDYLLKDMWDNNLDGIDMDYEPEGDPLSGSRMTVFVKYLGQFIGPMSPNPDKLLIIDHYGQVPPTECEPYTNWKVRQAYGQTISDSSFTSGWPKEKQVFTENIGDNWRDGGKMEQQAAFQPSDGSRKGGFGAFHNQRDYNTEDSGADNKVAYGHLRRAIQLQNPAVTK